MIDDDPPEFVDTNVLVYAHDTTAGEKHARAEALVRDLWKRRAGCLSVQVLQELYVVLTRKVRKPLSEEVAARILSTLSAWKVHAPVASDVLDAIEISRRQSIAYWDAMILQSAVSLGCTILWSEDLNPGQIYEGVKVMNPFDMPGGQKRGMGPPMAPHSA